MRKTNKERQLNNIIKRNISEISSELTEEKKIGSDCNGAKGNDGCPRGSFCSGMPTRKAGKCQGMVSNPGGKPKGVKTYGKKTRRAKEASKHITMKESELIKIIKRTINESKLLLEKNRCKSDNNCESDEMCRDYSGDGQKRCEDKPPYEGGKSSNGNKGGTKSQTTISGSWSNISSVLSTSEKSGKLGNNTAFEVLDSIKNLHVGPEDTPTGKARCGNVNDFGGDDYCFTPDHKGWTLTIWFSDMTLKENIELVGKSKSGVNIYEFDYINKEYGNGRYRGVMAQEVPSASKVGPGGKLMVDYSKLDVDFERLN